MRGDLTIKCSSDKDLPVADASLFEIAVQFHRTGQADRAELLYRRVLDQAPEHGDALFLLSVLTLESGRLPEAAALLERAVRSAPNNAFYLSSLGGVYRGLGRMREAVAVLLMAVVPSDLIKAITDPAWHKRVQ